MKKNMLWIGLIILILVLAAGAYAINWFQNNHLYTPVDYGPIVNKICRSTSGGTDNTLTIYTNTKGDVGGYARSPELQKGSFWGFLYDTDGNIVDLGLETNRVPLSPDMAYMSASASVRSDLTQKALAWIASVKNGYPVQKVVQCPNTIVIPN